MNIFLQHLSSPHPNLLIKLSSSSWNSGQNWKLFREKYRLIPLQESLRAVPDFEHSVEDHNADFIWYKVLFELIDRRDFVFVVKIEILCSWHLILHLGKSWRSTIDLCWLVTRDSCVDQSHIFVWVGRYTCCLILVWQCIWLYIDSWCRDWWSCKLVIVLIAYKIAHQAGIFNCLIFMNTNLEIFWMSSLDQFLAKICEHFRNHKLLSIHDTNLSKGIARIKYACNSLSFCIFKDIYYIFG